MLPLHGVLELCCQQMQEQLLYVAQHAELARLSAVLPQSTAVCLLCANTLNSCLVSGYDNGHTGCVGCMSVVCKSMPVFCWNANWHALQGINGNNIVKNTSREVDCPLGILLAGRCIPELLHKHQIWKSLDEQ